MACGGSRRRRPRWPGVRRCSAVVGQHARVLAPVGSSRGGGSVGWRREGVESGARHSGFHGSSGGELRGKLQAHARVHCGALL
jgi:hypothetical protein